jgi:hypothetical protein
MIDIIMMIRDLIYYFHQSEQTTFHLGMEQWYATV